MTPKNNIELGQGTLYMLPPDGAPVKICDATEAKIIEAGTDLNDIANPGAYKLRAPEELTFTVQIPLTRKGRRVLRKLARRGKKYNRKLNKWLRKIRRKQLRQRPLRGALNIDEWYPPGAYKTEADDQHV